MSKAFSHVCFALLLAASLSATASPAIFSAPSTGGTYTELTFSLPSMRIENTELDDVTYQRLSHPMAGSSRRVGYPELPTFSTTLAVPAGAQVSIELVDSQQEAWQDMRVYPAQAMGFEATQLPVIEQAVYSGRQTWQPEAVSVSQPATLRDFHVVTCTVSPFEWDPVSGEMTMRTMMRVRIHHQGQATPPARMSRSFVPLYQSFISNYDSIMRDVEPEFQPRSLIVVHNNNTGLRPHIDQFMDWKRTKGFEVNEYYGGSSSAAIRDYLQDAYANWDNPPEYIVIIGDVGGSYGVPTFYESAYGGEGDHLYGCLDGDDLLPEAFVGRISIDTQTEFITYLSKMNIYERDVYMDDTSLYHHSLLVGDTAPSGLSCVITNKYVKELISDDDPNHTFTELYAADPSASQMDTAINAGSLFFNYRGWIGMSGWSWTNISNLTNINKLTNGIILTCATGSFAATTARSEAFIRVGTPTEPRGAICAIGMATSGTHTQYNNILCGGIFAGLYADRMNTMGEATMRGKLALYQAYQNCDPTNVLKFTYWCNLMGDPSMQMWRTEPLPMNATFDTTLPLGRNWIEVAITDDNGQPLEGAWVTARMGNDDIFASDYTDADGTVTLHFDGSQSGDVDLTVTRADYLPILDEFTIETVGGLAYESMTLNDIVGNGNGQPNPGETIEMDIELHNYDSSVHNGVSAVLSSESEHIAVTTDTQSFGDIAAGTTGSSSQPFVFTIAADTPDRYDAAFELAVTDDAGGSWNEVFWLSVQGNDLDIIEWEVIDGGNGVLDPGETTLFDFTVENNGMTNLFEVYGELSSISGMVDIQDSIAFFGDIAIGATADASANRFEITALAQLVPGMTVPLTLRLYNADGYEETEHYGLPIGITTLTDPIGPDSYGYMCYDDGDTGYIEAPVYDWVEIDPTQGGSGIDTGINDNGDEQDENANIALPFTFSFYGLEYDNVTVNSNGWITFGDTENLCFRNWPVPGPLGPRPMIAAFWDNLYTTGGGVYTYYDTELHLFIIEWSNNQAVSGGTNTFQIILYDPISYPTASGDGPIKIQYHTFSNTDGNTSASGPQGNYCTVGLEDHTGVVGLQYTYNDEYPVGAKVLDDETAIFFTGIPVSYENDYLIMGVPVLHDANGNGCVEAGEVVNLGAWVNNIGEGTATEVHATLSSNDPWVTISDSLSTYLDIEGGYCGIGLDYMCFEADLDVPAGHSLAFVLHLESASNQWDYPFAIPVHKPQFNVPSYFLNDSQGNNDGVADPGETVLLAINVTNTGLTNASDVTGILSCASPHVTIVEGEHVYGDIADGQTLQRAYTVDISASAPTQTAIPFSFEVSGPNAETLVWEFSIGITVSPEVLDEFFAFWLPDGWTIDANSQNWSQSNTNHAGGVFPEAMLLWMPQFSGVSHLICQPLNLMGATNVSIDFKHMINHFSGNGYVLGLDIRAGGGAWESVWEIPAGDQSAELITIPITSPLLNQPDFQFGWYLSGDSYDINYWYIDDIFLNATLGNSASVSGELTIVGGESTPDNAIVSLGGYATHPDTDGAYTLFASPGDYDLLQGAATFYSPDEHTDLTLLFGDELTGLDFELHWLAPADTLSMDIDFDECEALLTWEYTEPAPLRKVGDQQRRLPGDRQTFDHFNIWRQLDTGPFILHHNTIDQYWSEPIDTLRSYTYYVTVQYAEGVSDSTNHQCTGDWEPPHDENDDVVVYGDWLGANFPNPFNPVTTIRFSMSSPGKVELKVYNIRGRLVRTLTSERYEAGVHEIRWEGDNDSGRNVASGVYFYRLSTPHLTEVRKALLLK
ncbi:MAG: T9SS type A sorting domain-containing protein [Candidatus Cloacimonetes bacterium]|nr:T9SS type A sorting domain-containing protein [Candidatus Cloacimonadota bacterium]